MDLRKFSFSILEWLITGAVYLHVDIDNRIYYCL